MKALAKLTADALRENFLHFYKEQDHLLMPAASLIPQGDPTLLLTNSGMAQFKAYFSGEQDPPHRRVATAQRCFRTTDIEEVGDETHLTLFEMLGNFSFGDYFKKEACEWALKLMTDVLGFDFDKLFFTIHSSDEETGAIWREIGVPAERIYSFGDDHNWWGPAGREGPCGPCSEIHYFTGEMPATSSNMNRKVWGPNIHPDFIELYNLVFTQFYRDEDGKDTVLPQKNIDTGMGLERTITVMHGKKSVYETGNLAEIAAAVRDTLKAGEYSADTERAVRVVADHGRAAAFLLSDGVLPENTGRGYVLRRIIRRSMLFGKMGGLSENACTIAAETTSEVMEKAYPELKANLPFILSVLHQEQKSFLRVLDFGSDVLTGMIDFRRRYASLMLKNSVKTRSLNNGSNKERLLQDGVEAPHGDDAATIGATAAFNALCEEVEIPEGVETPSEVAISSLLWHSHISGSEAFLLNDTYGFPVEMTKEFVKNQKILDVSMGLNMEAFLQKVEKQRAQGRARFSAFGGKEVEARIYRNLNIDVTEFLGYKTTKACGTVLGIIKGGESVNQIGAGDTAEVILDKTPFYAERGGQIGDTGTFANEEFRANVTNTQSPYAGITVHSLEVNKGKLSKGDNVDATVDPLRREKIRRNHTATHLLHAALRELLGKNVRQCGSVVHPDYLRFDFTYDSSLMPDEIIGIQQRVNSKIRENFPVEVRYTTHAEALEDGALAFFGDTYEKDVRTVRIDGRWSYELCGGTHMDATGGIGAFVIISESGIGKGVRRMFALTGVGAEEEIWRRFRIVDNLSEKLRVPPEQLERRSHSLLDELADAHRRISKLEDDLLEISLSGRNKGNAERYSLDIDGQPANLEVHRVEATNVAALRKVSDHIRNRLDRGIAVVGAVIDERPVIIVSVTKNLVDYVRADALARTFAEVLKGGGGGRADMAQAGGKYPHLLDSALTRAKELVKA